MILRALPLKWRQRTAVARPPTTSTKARRREHDRARCFNTVPLLRRGGGSLNNGAFDHVDRLIKQRWNLLSSPKGRARVMAARQRPLGRRRDRAYHEIPIVPVRVRDARRDASWPELAEALTGGKLLRRRHTVEVEFGAPIWSRGTSRRRRSCARPGVPRGPRGPRRRRGRRRCRDGGGDAPAALTGSLPVALHASDAEPAMDAEGCPRLSPSPRRARPPLPAAGPRSPAPARRKIACATSPGGGTVVSRIDARQRPP